MYKRLLILLGIIFFSIPGQGVSLSEVEYSGLGNFKAIAGFPDGKPPFPCIIYAYDEYLDWRGIRLAQQDGYDIKYLATQFAHQGIVIIIPIERFKKLDSLSSAIDYAKSLPIVDRKKISLVGMSEGGFLALMLLKDHPEIKRSVVTNPLAPDQAGFFSVGTLLENSQNLKTSILFYMSQTDTIRRRSNSLQLFHGFRSRGVNVTYKEKAVNRKWFWYSSPEFISDITLYLKGQ